MAASKRICAHHSCYCRGNPLPSSSASNSTFRRKGQSASRPQRHCSQQVGCAHVSCTGMLLPCFKQLYWVKCVRASLLQLAWLQSLHLSIVFLCDKVCASLLNASKEPWIAFFAGSCLPVRRRTACAIHSRVPTHICVPYVHLSTQIPSLHAYTHTHIHTHSHAHTCTP